MIACVALALTAGHAVTADGSSIRLREGAVIDPSSGRAYLMRVGGGIEAVDVRAGTTVWSTTLADKPLAVVGDVVVAQAEPTVGPHVLRIVGLESAGPVKVRFDAHVELDEGMHAGIDAIPGSSLDVRARFFEDAVIVRWRHTRFDVATPEGAGDRMLVPDALEGAARIDPESGATETLAKQSLLETDEDPLPASVEAKLAAGELPRPPVRSGDLLVHARRVRRGTREAVVVQRFDRISGAALPEVTLFDGDDTLYRYLSVDGLHLLGSRRVDGLARYTWTVCAVHDLACLEPFTAERPAAPFVVSGAIAVFEAAAVDGVSATIRAVDVTTGRTLWERAVRDTADHGPLPARQ